MTDHEQPAAGVALKPRPEGMSDALYAIWRNIVPGPDYTGNLKSDRDAALSALGKAQARIRELEAAAPTDAGGAVSEDCQTQASVDRVIGRRVAQQMRDKAAKLARSDKPNMAADMIEEAEALERLAARSLRSLAADRDKAVGLLRRIARGEATMPGALFSEADAFLSSQTRGS